MSPTPPGSPHRSEAPRPLRGIPRSRAYWELKAEQMINRVFDPEATIDVDGGEAAAPGPPQPADKSATARSSQRHPRGSRPHGTPRAAAAAGRRHDPSLLLITTLAGVCLVSAASSLFYVSHWNRLQQSLSQERNLLLVERLRSLGPATATPLAGPEPAAPSLPQPGQTAAGTSAEGLPPPPPEEPWIQQLSTLPASGTAPPGLLRVPLSPQVLAKPPATATSSPSPSPAPSSPPLPQLVGVVGVAGKTAAAIFLVGGSSMSVSSGETIGSSGWRLRSAAGETALIERGNELRQVSIINGF